MPTSKKINTEKTLKKPQGKWWEEGLRFQCQGSGKCCTSHGEYGFVFLTKDDRQKIANHLGLTLSVFTRRHCERTNGFFHLKEDPKNTDCMFLKNKRCSIYEARPVQCRTWPFWPEVMNAKTWNKEVVTFCPGVGKGPVVPVEQIKKQIEEQTASELSSEVEARDFLQRARSLASKS